MALAEVFVLDVVLEGDDAVDELHPPAARANTTIAGIHRAARRFRYVGGTPTASPCVGQRWRRYRRNALAWPICAENAIQVARPARTLE
jgi:hypothetical protein